MYADTKLANMGELKPMEVKGLHTLILATNEELKKPTKIGDMLLDVASTSRTRTISNAG